MEVLYGLNPALHRAYAIAGDLMENLRAYYSELRTVPGGIDARMDQLSKDGDAGRPADRIVMLLSLLALAVPSFILGLLLILLLGVLLAFECISC